MLRKEILGTKIKTQSGLSKPITIAQPKDDSDYKSENFLDTDILLAKDIKLFVKGLEIDTSNFLKYKDRKGTAIYLEKEEYFNGGYPLIPSYEDDYSSHGDLRICNFTIGSSTFLHNVGAGGLSISFLTDNNCKTELSEYGYTYHIGNRFDGVHRNDCIRIDGDGVCIDQYDSNGIGFYISTSDHCDRVILNSVNGLVLKHLDKTTSLSKDGNLSVNAIYGNDTVYGYDQPVLRLMSSVFIGNYIIATNTAIKSIDSQIEDKSNKVWTLDGNYTTLSNYIDSTKLDQKLNNYANLDSDNEFSKSVNIKNSLTIKDTDTENVTISKDQISINTLDDVCEINKNSIVFGKRDIHSMLDIFRYENGTLSTDVIIGKTSAIIGDLTDSASTSTNILIVPDGIYIDTTDDFDGMPALFVDRSSDPVKIIVTTDEISAHNDTLNITGNTKITGTLETTDRINAKRGITIAGGMVEYGSFNLEGGIIRDNLAVGYILKYNSHYLKCADTAQLSSTKVYTTDGTIQETVLKSDYDALVARVAALEAKLAQ